MVENGKVNAADGDYYIGRRMLDGVMMKEYVETAVRFRSKNWCSESMRNFSRRVASKDRDYWGWFFLMFGFVSFSGFFYAAIISKLLPPSDNALVSAIQNDRYYCFLVPLTLPILVVAVYFHWLSMKFFKHA